MALIVTKLGQQGLGRAVKAKSDDQRRGRVARVSAKAAGRAKRKADDSDEAELEIEAVAADSDDGEVAEKPARGDGGTYLSMYFRDMAELDVLRPEEEFTSAREI